MFMDSSFSITAYSKPQGTVSNDAVHLAGLFC